MQPCSEVLTATRPPLFGTRLEKQEALSPCASHSRGVCPVAVVTVVSLVEEGRVLSLECEKLATAAERTPGAAGRALWRFWEWCPAHTTRASKNCWIRIDLTVFIPLPSAVPAPCYLLMFLQPSSSRVCQCASWSSQSSSWRLEVSLDRHKSPCPVSVSPQPGARRVYALPQTA